MAESINQHKIVALIVAAGKGKRMGTSESKQYLSLAGEPILVHTIRAFESIPLIDEIALVVSDHDVERCQMLARDYQINKLRYVVAGGVERQHSVLRGLEAVATEAQYVLIHDGVRPFIDESMIERLVVALRDEERAAVVVAVPVKDTIKMSRTMDSSEIIDQTLPRDRLWAIQTPQAFRMSTILDAHRQAAQAQYLGTDDAVLVERLGEEVHIVQGNYFNIKITTPDDLVVAEAIIKQRQERSI